MAALKSKRRQEAAFENQPVPDISNDRAVRPRKIRSYGLKKEDLLILLSSLCCSLALDDRQALHIAHTAAFWDKV